MRLSLILLLSLALTGAAFAQQQRGVRIEQDGTANLVAEGETGRACTLINVAAYADRVWIQCSSGNDSGSINPRDLRAPLDTSVVFFATDNTALADRVIALATAASQQNKQLAITYRNNPAENPSGCRPRDCRRLSSIVMILRPQ